MPVADGFVPPERFRIRETLAEGDAEILYRGEDTVLQREVLLKRPGPAVAAAMTEAGDTDRALREARALAGVHHPGVVSLLDVIDCDGGPLLVMEPIPGVTLAERLECDGPLAAAEVVELGVELAAALSAVHGNGVVHRGLSTGNIIIKPDGKPCLVGFLFAKFCQASMGITSISYGGECEADREETRRVLPAHPAPEQLYGQAADARSDLFGLGCILYRCLTGEHAFPELVTAGWTPPKDPSSHVGKVPKGLATAIMKCLSRSPLSRFQSAGELGQALEALRPKAVVDGAAAPRGSRLPVPLLAGAALAIVAVAVTGFFALREGDSGAGTEATAAGWDQSRPLAVEEGRDGDSGDASRTTVPGRDQLMDPGGGDASRNGCYSAYYENSYALVIGIGEAYAGTGFPVLPNAERDAEAIAQKLQSFEHEHWKVELLKGPDATRDRIEAEIESLGDDTRVKKDDRVFVYYAGHGHAHPSSGELGYIIPVDAERSDPDSFIRNKVSFDAFNGLFKATDAKHVLVAVDCCYGGRLTVRRASLSNHFEKRHLTQKAHVILTSGREDEEVPDGYLGEGSPFARTFLRMLGNPEQGALTSPQLWMALEEEYKKENLAQTPKYGTFDYQSDGEFVFFLKPPGDE